MKLTLDVNHPLAQAIQRATHNMGDSQAILRLTVTDRHDDHSRVELAASVKSWAIVGNSGRHARETDVVFDVEFLEPPLITSPYQITNIRGGRRTAVPDQIITLAADTRREHTWIGLSDIEWSADPEVEGGWLGFCRDNPVPIRVPPQQATDPYGPFRRRKETTR